MPFLFSIMNGHLFSVEAAEMIVPPLGDDLAILHKNATDQGVGTHAPTPSFCDQ
jgi:hypothetical protein